MGSSGKWTGVLDRLRGPRTNQSSTDAASWIVAPLVLAIGIPLTGALGPNTLFFTAHGLPAWTWLVLALASVIITWLLVFAILRLLHARVTERTWDWVSTGAVFGLWGFCAFNIVGRFLLSSLWAVAAFAGLLIGLAVAWLARRVRMGSVLLGCALIAACVPMVNPLIGSAPVARAATLTTSSPPSVVWAVADELQYPLIFDSAGRVRPQFPNLRALQDTSTTYTRAFTPANYTDFAMPALFNGVTDVGGLTDGQRADMKASRGIFPALSTAYSVVMESPLFRFQCTATNCVNASPDANADVLDQLRLLIADTTAVIGKVSLAPVLADNLPSLDGKWRDFWSTGDDAGGQVLAIPAQRFIDAMHNAQSSSDAPVLGLWHTMRTHAPWTVDANGEQWYPGRLPVVPGSHMVGTDGTGHFTTQETEQLGRRMYALSAVEFDRQVGILIDAMKRDGTFDGSMFIVTADHGVAFTRFRDRRLGDDDEQMWSEVAHVPLLVKSPDQDKPEVVTAVRSSAQIAQTILDTVGATDTGLDLAPALTNDPVAAPVFTNVAGGAMTRWSYDGMGLVDPWTRDTLESPGVIRPFVDGIDESLLGKPVPSSWTPAAGADIRVLPGKSTQMVVAVDRRQSACSIEPGILAQDGTVVASIVWGRTNVAGSSAVESGSEAVVRGWAIAPRGNPSTLSVWCPPE